MDYKRLTEDGIQELLNMPDQSIQKLDLVLQLIETDFSQPLTTGVISDGHTKIVIYFLKEARAKILTIKHYSTEIRPIIKLLQAKCSKTNEMIIVIIDFDYINDNYVGLIGNPIWIKDQKPKTCVNLQGSKIISQQDLTSLQISLTQDIKKLTVNTSKDNQRIDNTTIKIKNPQQNSSPKPVLTLTRSQKKDNNIGSIKQEGKEYVPIRFLNDRMNQWRIMGRVTFKSQKQSFMKEKQANFSDLNTIDELGHYFNIDILDSDNDEINCAFYKQACQENFDKIQQGNIYEFSRGQIKRHKQYYLPNQEFQISFVNQASVKQLKDDGSIERIKVKITNIDEANKLQLNSMIDVIGLIKDDAELKSINLKNGEIKSRRSAQIFDQTGWIQIVLWGIAAENTNLRKNQIICLKNIKVQEFQNNKELVAGGQTRIFQDQNLLGEIKEGLEILSWYSKIQGEVVLQNESQINQEITRYCSEIVDESLQNLENPRYKQVSEVRAYISYIKLNGSLYYISCTKCPKKVHYQSDIYHCNSCQIDISEPNYKYIVRGRISDTSGSMWVTFYDDHMQQILNGLECKEFIKMDGEIQESTIKKAFNQEYRLRILSKSEEYEGSLRTQNKVMKIPKNNYSQETKELLDYIKI